MRPRIPHDPPPFTNVVDRPLLARIRLPVYTEADYQGAARKLRSWSLDDGFRSLGLIHSKPSEARPDQYGTLEVETAWFEARDSGRRRILLPLEHELWPLRPTAGPPQHAPGGTDPSHETTPIRVDGDAFALAFATRGETWVGRVQLPPTSQGRVVLTLRAIAYPRVSRLVVADPADFLD